MGNAKPWIAMKLPELKQRTKRAWEAVNTWKGGVVIQPENFDKEMRSLGDRRRKDTWVKGLCKFKAMLAYKSCLDAWALLTITFNFRPDRWDYEYRHQILDEFLMYPDGLEIIKSGLEDLYSQDFSPKEREEANAFFRLLAEREGESRRIGFSIGSDRTLAGLGAAA